MQSSEDFGPEFYKMKVIIWTTCNYLFWILWLLLFSFLFFSLGGLGKLFLLLFCFLILGIKLTTLHLPGRHFCPWAITLALGLPLVTHWAFVGPSAESLFLAKTTLKYCARLSQKRHKPCFWQVTSWASWSLFALCLCGSLCLWYDC